MSSYDSMFNDGMLRVARKTSSLQRPNQWPKHVSAMRQHTSYEGQMSHESHSPSFYSDFMTQRAHPQMMATHNPQYHGQYHAATVRARAAHAKAMMHAAAHAAKVRAHAARLRSMGYGAPQNPNMHVSDARRWAWTDNRA